MKKLFHKKGFTLAEVLVASAITVILLASVMAVFSSTSGIISSMKSNPFADRIENSVCDYIRRSTEKANGYRVSGVAQSNLTAEAITLMSELTCGTGESNRCLIVSNTEGAYRLYDLGAVTSGDIMTKIANLTDYKVYNSEYYENMSCRLALGQTMDSNSRVSYFNVTAQLFDSDGSNVGQPTSTYFKMLNAPDATNAQVKTAGLDDLTTAYPDTDSCIIFIYRIKDYTTA